MAKRKQKSCLARLMNSCEKNLYETTINECKFWFNILNQEIFNGALSTVDEIDIRWRKGTYAYYVCYNDTRKTVLCMNKKYRSKKFFIEVLAHEMIHHHQFLHGEPLGHGPSFRRWKNKFNKNGIGLRGMYTRHGREKYLAS